jgi:hypothetical protein
MKVMKTKKICSLILINLILLTLKSYAIDIPGMSGDTLLIPKASHSPVIDGEMDDIWYQIAKIRNNTYVVGTEPAKWTDSFFWFKVMWDDNNFYMFAAVFDDEINTNNSNVWERDGFEIYFDGDNSKNDLSVGYDANDVQFRWIYGEATGNPGTANAKHAFKLTDYGFNFELAIPINELPFSFEENHIFGFDIQYNDNDGGSRQHVAKWWSSSDDNYRNPSLFGNAKLTGREVSDYLDVHKTTNSPVIDGAMDDIWKGAPDVTNNKYCMLNGTNYNNFSGWNDLIYNLKVLWDDSNFYLFANVLDNEINTSLGNEYENDSFEIYIDGDNSKNTQAQGYDANDVHYTFVYGVTTENTGLPNSKHAWQKTDSGFQFEIKIPTSDLPFELTSGHVFGFELQLNDNDNGVRNKIAKWWSESDNSWLDASLFGTAQLVSDQIIPQVIPADKPEYSVNHGFYDTSFDLTVESSTPNSIIKYTLDGSDPVNSTTALQKTSPAVIRIDPESTEGPRDKTPAVILRACAIATGYLPSESETKTYLFIDKVKTLSPDKTKPGPNWPAPTTSANPQSINYGMDPNILNDPRYKDVIDDALLSVPTISIATDLNNLFSLSTGIYMNALSDGSEWERPVSVELLNPDGSDGFQINAGLRIRGGWSRHGDNPKHAFRLFFREEYGKGKLKYKLFEDEGIDEFDKIDLRTSQNYSWSYPWHMGEYNTMTRDVFCRDLQRETGQPYTRSRYCHLYLDGVYWGLFQTQERAEARFAASYLGGNIEDYDVIKNENGGTIATDGNNNAYREIWNFCTVGFKTNANYFKLLGRNEDGSINASYKNLVDIDNLIDYMLNIFYTGNFDSPTSKFGNNQGTNNFYCIYNRNANDGFKFFIHDAEHTLRTTSGEGPGIGINENRVNINMYVSSFSNFHPQWLHFKLSDNAEYKIKFADHVYKHMFNQGCMTPDKATALFLSRAKEIEMAIIGESARWGDASVEPPRTKDDNWQWAVDDIVNDYFPYRTNIVIDQLKSANLYPNINPPIFINNNQEILSNRIGINSNYDLKLQNPNVGKGTIYYTTDGQDPRVIGGSISGTAINGANEASITISTSTVVKARVLDGTTWSALHEITLYTNESNNSLKITEINYHPLDGTGVSGNEYEFLELKNIGTSDIILSQYYFSNGINYTFPEGSFIEPGKFIVLASNKQEFNNRYGFLPFDEYSGQLDNGGEKISLCNAMGDTILSVKYNDKAPWPETADTSGYTLVTKDRNPAGDLNDPANWRASNSINGSPAMDDLASTAVEHNSNETIYGFNLSQNYPNPFNPNTIISYQLSVTSNVKLKIFDILGNEVAVLVDEKQNAGSYNYTFSINNYELSSGIYFYRLQTTEGVLTKKMIILK